MKKIALAMLLFSPAVYADSDYHVVFEIVGNISVNDFYELALDIDLGDEYMAANGVMKAGALGVPATGTCFFTSTGGVFCNLQVDQDSYSVDLSVQLSGTLIVKGANGTIVDTAPIHLVDIY